MTGSTSFPTQSPAYCVIVVTERRVADLARKARV